MDATGLSLCCLKANTICSKFNFFILSKESNQKRSLFCIIHGIDNYFQETPSCAIAECYKNLKRIMNAFNMNSCSEHQTNNQDQYRIPSKF